MEDDFYRQERELEQQGLDLQGVRTVSLGRYTARTFLRMALGLLITFVVSVFWYYSDMTWHAYHAIPYFQIIVLVAELAVVIGMSAMLQKISPAAAMACFLVYSVLTGITFSTYFYIYDAASLTLIFGATALYFGGMAVFGYLTNIDLSRIRSVLLGGLIFLIIANVAMLFIPGLAVADRVICTVGVVIFLAYTAYDTQKIRTFYQAFSGDEVMLKKASIISALQLYLDFINLFLYLLRLFGKRRN